MSPQKNIEELKLNKLFTDVNEKVINSIYKPDNFKTVKEGDVIYRTGDHSIELFLLLRGEVKIKFPSHNYKSNKVFNDFFGEKELFDKTLRNSSAVAINNCLLYIIKKHILETLVNKSITIKKNIEIFGEMKIPEVTPTEKSRIDLSKSMKPRLFRAISSSEEEDTDDQEYTVIEDLSKIDNSDIQIDDPSIKIENEIIDEEHEVEATIESEIDGNMYEEDRSLQQENEPERQEQITSYETIKFLDVLNSINNNITMLDTTISIVQELRKYTSSEAGELYLIDKQSKRFKKLEDENKIISVVKFKNSEGLTGACALQGKTINFDKPAKDSRFVADIDQPGKKELNSIIYLPLVGQSGETVGVLQLARKNKAYSDKEANHSEMLTNHAALVIERCTAIENLIQLEKQKSFDDIEDFLKENLFVPINVINSFTSHLTKDSFSKKIRDMFALIQNQTSYIGDIFLSAFNYYKTNFKLNTEKVNINDYMNSIVEQLSYYCASRNINLYKKTSDDTDVIIDSGKLYMAIFQLIENACNVSEESGKVFINSYTDGDYLIIDVIDEGPGIPDELIESIFTPGYSNIKGRNRFGLPIAKRIVELHSGQLSFSRKAKVGSTFTIRIPVVKNTIESQRDDESGSNPTPEELKTD
jgi:signal transduction histidine kinase/CRP-like cAMP-binding protein